MELKSFMSLDLFSLTLKIFFWPSYEAIAPWIRHWLRVTALAVNVASSLQPSQTDDPSVRPAPFITRCLERRNVRRILVRGINDPLPPEAKKILKI